MLSLICGAYLRETTEVKNFVTQKNVFHVMNLSRITVLPCNETTTKVWLFHSSGPFSLCPEMGTSPSLREAEWKERGTECQSLHSSTLINLLLPVSKRQKSFGSLDNLFTVEPTPKLLTYLRGLYKPDMSISG